MDLTIPYEVTSDQDVASMFVIPAKDTDSDQLSTDAEAQNYKHESKMETEEQSNDNLSSLNPSYIIATSQNRNTSEICILNIEPKSKDMDSDEDRSETQTINENSRRHPVDVSENGEPNDSIPHQKQFSMHKTSDNNISSRRKNTEMRATQNGTCEIMLNKTMVDSSKALSLKDSCLTLKTSRPQGCLQCPKCKRNFPIDADLTRHHCGLTKSAQEILSCAICRTTFDEMDKLKEHMRKHWESLPYKCHVCSERYWTEKSLKRHLIKHETREKPFACVECNAKYVHKRQLLLHMANVHSRDRAARKYPCDICGRNFLRKCDLTKHVKKCVDLEEESPLLEREDSPMVTNVDPETSGKTIANTDSVTDGGKVATNHQHVSQSPPKATGSKTDSHPDEKDSSTPSIKQDNNVLVPGAAISPSNLMSILSSIQGSGIPGIVPFFNTNVLGQNIFASPLLSMLPLLPVTSLIGQNSMLAASSPSTESSPSESSTNTTVPSPLATVRLSSRRKPKQPRRTISTMLSDLPSRPDMGEKIVDVIEIIRKNKKLATEDDNVQDLKEGALYNCQVCSKSFPTLCELQVHCTSHGSSIFSCKYCKKVLSSQVSLYRHEADHEDNRPFKCDLCDKAFVLKAELNRHIDIQHSKRPFTCKICRFNFSCQANLDAHMPVHIEKRSCPFCPRSFTTETYLQRHLAKHHGIVDSDVLM